MTTASADPCPKRAPFRYLADEASVREPDNTFSFPTMDCSLVGRARCSSVRLCDGEDEDMFDDGAGGSSLVSHEQHERGRPLGKTCGCCCCCCGAVTLPAAYPVARERPARARAAGAPMDAARPDEEEGDELLLVFVAAADSD